MPNPLILTLCGPDRPGIVHQLSEIVARHGGNWEESRMAHLAGQFAGLLLVTGTQAQLCQIEADLGAIDGLSLSVHRGDGGGAPSERVCLTLTGQDHPGIVRRVTALLHERGANIEDMSSECTDAPMAGGTLFTASFQLTLRSSADLGAIEASLEQLADDLVVELVG